MKTRRILSLVLALVTLFSCLSIVTFADDNTANLDTDTNKSKDIDQNYTFKQTGDTTYTDVYKVKLDWTVTDIAATYASTKTWNPDTKTWDETKTVADIADQTATFTLTNYSSEGIIANVEFEVEDSMKDTFDKVTFTNNNCAVKTPVTRDNNTYQDSDFTALNKTITSEITFNKDKFADLTATSSATKYGTYTVTIKAPQYLTFTAKKDNSSVTPKFLSGSYKYSIDNGKTWTNGTNDGTTTINLNKAGDNVILSGIDCQTGEDTQGNPICFSMTGSIAASGDVTSLTNGIGGNEALTDSCYLYMFYYCQSLVTAPNLPSENLAEYCYAAMFYACTSLVTAPDLPATTLTYGCYNCMFACCISLVKAPDLPATILAEGCYYDMFAYCKSLVTVSALKADTLSNQCYYRMFRDCTKLNVTTSKPTGTEGTDWGVIISGAKTMGTEAVLNMFYNCKCASGVDVTPTLAEGTTYYWYTE